MQKTSLSNEAWWLNQVAVLCGLQGPLCFAKAFTVFLKSDSNHPVPF